MGHSSETTPKSQPDHHTVCETASVKVCFSICQTSVSSTVSSKCKHPWENKIIPLLNILIPRKYSNILDILKLSNWSLITSSLVNKDMILIQTLERYWWLVILIRIRKTQRFFSTMVIKRKTGMVLYDLMTSEEDITAQKRRRKGTSSKRSEFWVSFSSRVNLSLSKVVRWISKCGPIGHHF